MPGCYSNIPLKVSYIEFNDALNKHGCLMAFSSSAPDATQFIIKITNLITPGYYNFIEKESLKYSEMRGSVEAILYPHIPFQVTLSTVPHTLRQVWWVRSFPHEEKT